ncbi:hypothetical protein KFL_000420270 [Klebsormidium nitens]|uniref:AB hydrolase-1 domain-containing protein n=1 Tax=Klebsormidium nitens TaxID=105231 RepID=A0A1Y1HTV5_KLENI|nr:hypothetical protein KFL_000420270 [Klebsormidium nitens]|eukprot:GAQ79956.1 hypothetical protein KFL_000420270 [Klebsormidium nitens]
MARHSDLQLPFGKRAAPVGPVFAVLLVFCALLLGPAISSKSPKLSKPADVAPDVNLPDEAVSERKAVFDVTISDGTHHNLAVFIYELSALEGGSEPHVSEECKKNQDVALVLFHGAAYNHKYWDVPFSVDNSSHSLARYLAKQCYFVLAADMLGTGESDKPDGFAIDVADQAHASADFLWSIHSDHNPARERQAEKVIVIGHSFGSIMSQLILGTNPGIADGFVATGWSNGYEPEVPHFEDVFNAVDQPPNSMPYITLPTGGPPFDGINLRSAYYDGVDSATFQMPNPHPTWTDAMLTYDTSSLADYITHKNAFLDAVPLLDNRRNNAANAPDYIFNTFHTDQASSNAFRSITSPVFMLCGENDILANAAGCAAGGAYYPNSVSVTSFVQPNIGHVYNQHKTAVPGWEKIVDFVKSVVHESILCTI